MLEAVDTLQEEINKLQSLVNNFLNTKKTVRVLEVGCGSCSYIGMGQNAYIVGIDISEKQLQRNYILNEKILGDVQNYDLPASNFDLIVAWWIFEHLSQPETALKSCQKAVKEDGIIIIALPNLFSLKGLVTKCTPHWFHTWVYRFILDRKLAGTDDNPPFRTFLRLSTASASIKKFALKNGFSIEYFSLYEEPKQKSLREKYRVVGAGWELIKLMTKALSFGKIDAEFTDYIIVLKKQRVSAINFEQVPQTSPLSPAAS